ncbi:MAG TPA: substrate-binding domain-containing protein [Gemmatimonadales bacterium]|nr:substrate-binding domain-containing protein [Gemmatimonadales bacterium]
MRKPLLSLLAALTLISGGACGKHRAGDRPLVGVTLPAGTDAFSQALERGMRQAADSLRLDLRIVVAQSDAGRQTAQVDSFIDERVDAIVIAPVNSNDIVSAIEAANRANIPVFTSAIASDGGVVVAHVASDHRQGGQLVGAYIGRRLGGGGNVVILDQPTVSSVRDRVAGFREALRAFPNIRVLASPAVDGGSRDLAKQRTNNLLATGQKIDAVFGTNDESALGALAAIQAAGRTDMIVVGYDARPEGALVAAAVQDPVAIGRRTIEAVAARLRGESVPPVVPVPVGLVERDSLRP